MQNSMAYTWKKILPLIPYAVLGTIVAHCVKSIAGNLSFIDISSSRAIEALGDTRNELTHYIYKQGSLGFFISNPDTDTDNMVNLYARYVLEIAFRIAVLEEIGVIVTDEIKDYVMDEHLDWIKIEKHLDEDSVLPMNVFRQIVEKLQKQEKNP